MLSLAKDIIEITDEEGSLIRTVWMPRTRKVKNIRFKFPLVEGFADPQVFPWNGKWYFIATNDVNHNIGLHVREADTVDDLFTDKHRSLSYLIKMKSLALSSPSGHRNST